jgi:ATP adenylyltransferase
MDYLWSPWRYKYISQASPSTGCVFCEKSSSADDRENLIIYRGEFNFVLLNLFPYTNGHMMVAPYQHVASLEEAPEETVVEMMRLARTATRHLHTVYKPQGMNLGMNLGESAGAGIAGHIHMHVLPRWTGDSNFMTVVGETRVIPEAMDVTWQKLTEAFKNS